MTPVDLPVSRGSSAHMEVVTVVYLRRIAMSKRKDRWAAVCLPGLVKVQARANCERYASLLADPVRWARAVQVQLMKLDQPLGPELSSTDPENAWETARKIMQGQLEVAGKVERASGFLAASPLYWVTAPMAQVAMDASLDVPEIDASRDMPSPTGFIAFEKDLPALPSYNAMGENIGPSSVPDSVQPSALFWHPHEDQIRIVAYARNANLPPHIDGDMRSGGPLAEIVSFLVSRDGASRLADYDETDPRVGALLAFLSATWVLMMTPTVAQRKTIDPKTGGEPRPGAAPSVPLVTTIDLRPLRHEVKTEETDESGRVYRHRWVVRGHWRNQAHGPGRTKRRMTWVPPTSRAPGARRCWRRRRSWCGAAEMTRELVLSTHR